MARARETLHVDVAARHRRVALDLARQHRLAAIFSVTAMFARQLDAFGPISGAGPFHDFDDSSPIASRTHGQVATLAKPIRLCRLVVTMVDCGHHLQRPRGFHSCSIVVGGCADSWRMSVIARRSCCPTAVKDIGGP